MTWLILGAIVLVVVLLAGLFVLGLVKAAAKEPLPPAPELRHDELAKMLGPRGNVVRLPERDEDGAA